MIIFRQVIKTILILSLCFYPLISYAQYSFDIAISDMAHKIIRYMAESDKTKIAILPFQELDSNQATTFGKFIAEELTTILFESGKFKIIERNLINQIIKELKLSQIGVIDQTSAKELGKLSGVDAIVTGTIQDLVTRVAINCRLIETETGTVFAAASVKIIKDEALSQILGKYARSLEENLPNKPDRIENAIQVKNQVVYIRSRENNLFAMQLDKIIISKESQTTCEFIIENLTNRLLKFTLYLRRYALGGETYLLDEKGSRYPALSCKGLSQNGPIALDSIPPGGPHRIAITFPEIINQTSKINIVCFVAAGEMASLMSTPYNFFGYITFKNINIQRY